MSPATLAYGGILIRGLSRVLSLLRRSVISLASQVTLTSRHGVDHTQCFPELVKAVAELEAPSLILDGEVAVFDRELISRFEWLRTRPKHEVSTPPL